MVATAKSEAKAQHLINEGMMLFWNKGYNATSVKDIVEASALPKGSFYFYFDSKEHFAEAVIESYFQRMATPAMELLKNNSGDAKTRLIEFYAYRIKTLKEDYNCSMGCMGANLVSEMGEHSERIRVAVEQKSLLVKNLIIETVEEAQDQGNISSEFPAADLVNFIEDAGRGAMVSMKETNSSYPVDNFFIMVKKLLS